MNHRVKNWDRPTATGYQPTEFKGPTTQEMLMPWVVGPCMQRNSGGKFHPTLNRSSRPIANKYHEGKMNRTLERELKVFEIAESEANGATCRAEIAVGLCEPWACKRKLTEFKLSCTSGKRDWSWVIIDKTYSIKKLTFDNGKHPRLETPTSSKKIKVNTWEVFVTGQVTQ